MKGCSALLIIREMQIKVQCGITSYRSGWPLSKSLQMKNDGKGVEKREHSYDNVGGNVSWCSHYGELYGGSLKKRKTELPYDSEFPLLGIYMEKIIIWKDTCTPIFIAALFMMAKTWEPSKCLSTEEWIKRMWDIHIDIRILLSHKRNEVMPFAATWMDLEIITLGEVTKIKTNTIWYQLYVESKIWHKWTYLWNRNRLIDIENKLTVTKGEG